MFWYIAAGFAGYIVGRKSSGATILPQLASSNSPKAQGAIVTCMTDGSSAPPGAMPRSGYATQPGYTWCYRVRAGDTAGSIAAAIVGDDGRYQELVLANPEIMHQGVAGVYRGDNALNFAGGALNEGTVIRLPDPWESYVDQMGKPKGNRLPYPEDSRGKVATGRLIEGPYGPDVLMLPEAV